MGIDIYMKWPGQTEAEERLQITGWSTEAGNAGYLREAYHGGPYVTRFLLGEAFGDENEVKIPASVLRERLPIAVMMSIYRDHKVYGEEDPSIIELGDAPIEPGDLMTQKPMLEKLASIFGPGGEIDAAKSGTEGEIIAKATSQAQREGAVRLIESRRLGPTQLAFVEFVELAERMEAKTGSPVTILASY